MFGLLTKKQLGEETGKLLRQMEGERLRRVDLEREHDGLFAKLKALEQRIEVLEGTRPSNMLTPAEVETEIKKRVEANRVARIKYRKTRNTKDASIPTPS